MAVRRMKIFCIGFNKTGTTSLHSLFINCNFTCVHNTEWCTYSNIKDGAKYFTAQCYSDGEQSNFINLDRWFPNSLFVLNIRPVRSWLHSRIKHVLRYNLSIEKKELLTNKRYGKMARDFFIDEFSTINKWILERKIYHEQARLYFNNRSSFIETDITEDKCWAQGVIKFLDKNNVLHSNDCRSLQIHSNKRERKTIKNQDKLLEYFKMVEVILTKYSVEKVSETN